MAVEAVAYGDAHIDNQDPADAVYQEQQEIERDSHARRYAKSIREGTEQQGKGIRESPDHIHVQKQTADG